MNFWEFAGNHPWLTGISLFLILLCIESVAVQISKAIRGRSGKDKP